MGARSAKSMEDTTEDNSRQGKRLEIFVKENIVQKWLMRKVFKCIDLLDKGIPFTDAIVKICPDPAFEEVKANYKDWNSGRVRKLKSKRNQGS